MSKNEDHFPSTNPYAWPYFDMPLEDFLTKNKPSMVQNDGTKPWIWIKGPEPPTEDERVDEATEEASKLLKEVTDRVESIKNDSTIPVRSNKKTGVRSKKEVREQIQSDATEKLKEIAIRHHYVSGKWLIFVSPEKVDIVWSNLATSLISGALSQTSAYLAKVATSSEQESPNHQHVICLYMPDVYHQGNVTEVMKVLLRNLGANLSGVKSNLYTSIGIDSKHPSGIQSTIWKNSALLSDTESKELRDAFFADVASMAVKTDEARATVDRDVPKSSGKGKPKLKKKIDNDPFASDEDNAAEDEAQRKQELKTKKTGTNPKRTQHSDDEDDERPKKRVGKF